MEQKIIEKAKKQIEINKKEYIKYLIKSDINDVLMFAAQIMEDKVLNINEFVHYIYSYLCQMSENFDYFFALTKQKRKDLDYYHTTIIKIFMHLNAIFHELNKIKKRYSINLRK